MVGSVYNMYEALGALILGTDGTSNVRHIRLMSLSNTGYFNKIFSLEIRKKREIGRLRKKVRKVGILFVIQPAVSGSA